MKLVYTHENAALVQNARNLLENAGIKTTLKNEFASGGAGDLVPNETWPEVHVLDDQDYGKAAEILKALSNRATRLDWRCQGCGESNGPMFEICWNCQLGAP